MKPTQVVKWQYPHFWGQPRGVSQLPFPNAGRFTAARKGSNRPTDPRAGFSRNLKYFRGGGNLLDTRGDGLPNLRSAEAAAGASPVSGRTLMTTTTRLRSETGRLRSAIAGGTSAPFFFTCLCPITLPTSSTGGPLMYRLIASLLFCATCLLAPLAALAAPITVPTDLNVGDKYRLAFVTSTTRDATSSNIADYNSFVAAVAAGQPELAALGTTWSVIGSTATVDARDNTGTNPSATGVPIYRLDDTRIANSNADLWDGSLLAILDKREDGSLSVSAFVWTGTGILGFGASGGEHLGNSFVEVGLTSSVGGGWIDSSNFFSFDVRKFYAMSGELTVVPEPSSLFLVGIGATAVVGWQLRRRRHRKRQ